MCFSAKSTLNVHLRNNSEKVKMKNEMSFRYT
uniref:Uncharacterized protein n=1 Tax=Anguilla anguilla TaxID=7936 RepID=A0A0E9S3W1_ANGAN